MIIILLFCLCIANKNYEVYGSIPYLSKYEDLQLEEHLEVINKPPIKTIHVLLLSYSSLKINKKIMIILSPL